MLGTRHPFPALSAALTASVKLINARSPVQPAPFFHVMPTLQRCQIKPVRES